MPTDPLYRTIVAPVKFGRVSPHNFNPLPLGDLEPANIKIIDADGMYGPFSHVSVSKRIAHVKAPAFDKDHIRRPGDNDLFNFSCASSGVGLRKGSHPPVMA